MLCIACQKGHASFGTETTESDAIRPRPDPYTEARQTSPRAATRPEDHPPAISLLYLIPPEKPSPELESCVVGFDLKF